MKNIKTVALFVAAIGVVLFWVFGFKGVMEASKWSMITAGIAAWIAIFAIIAEAIYQKNHTTWDIDRKLPR